MSDITTTTPLEALHTGWLNGFDYRTLEEVRDGRDLPSPGNYVRLQRAGLVVPAELAADRALTQRGMDLVELGYPGLVDIRTGDRGTATEWSGPAVRHGSGYAWCDATGRHTGGGSYPGPQDVRPHASRLLLCDRCGVPAVKPEHEAQRTGPLASCCDGCRAAARPALAGGCKSADPQPQPEPTPCPHCGGELEAGADVWVKDVRLEEIDGALELVSFAPAVSADDPEAGLNLDGRVSCADCGREIEAGMSRMLGSWTFAQPAYVAALEELAGDVLAGNSEPESLESAAAQALRLPGARPAPAPQPEPQPREIDRYAADLAADAVALLTLAAAQDVSDPDDVPADVFERLEIDPDGSPWQDGPDLAREVLEARTLELTRRGTLPVDGSAPEVESVALLLGYGGPTVTLTVPAEGRPTLWHSWGEGTQGRPVAASLELPELESPHGSWQSLVGLLGPVWELEG